MANIRTDIDFMIVDGAEIIFKAPCDSCTVTGLKVYYPNSDGITVNEVFTFKDAHGNDLTDVDAFKADAMVKVILNTTDKTAYIQNADTNAYLEGRFEDIINGTTPVAISAHTHMKSQISDFPTSMPPTAHNHSASEITSGTLPVARGGTGATDAATARTNLGITPGNIGAAAASHGNHVPATQTASNNVFLRNDNTWQTVTPANIGAAASSHNQAASTVTAGTLGGKVLANATSSATVTNKQIRNIYAGTTDMTAGTTALTSGDIYVFYE